MHPRRPAAALPAVAGPGQVHEKLFAEQASGGASYLVAWRDEEPLGSGLLRWDGCIGTNARDAFPNVVEFTHLQVRDEFRRQGVGSRLIAAAEDEAVAEGKLKLAVGVSDDNPDAERLYLRLGYQLTEVHDVCEYDWIDEIGDTRHEVERNQLLLKPLGGHSCTHKVFDKCWQSNT